MLQRIILTIFLLGQIGLLSAQSNFTISGYIKDAQTGEEVIGATVYVKEIQNGSATNSYGFYSITLPAGQYTLIFRSIGFTTITKEIALNGNMELNIEFDEAATELNEVEVTAEAEN